MKRAWRILVSAALAASLVAALALPGAAVPGGGAKPPKNVIMFIGDGVGYNQYLAADYYLAGAAGTSPQEQFPVKLALSTYSHGASASTYDDSSCVYSPAMWGNFYAVSVNSTDSAAAATAMSTGVKTYDAAIGVNQDKQNLKHIIDDFEALGKATGVISTVPFSHATPAGFVAHNENRDNYFQIADEMIKQSAVDVIIGAGHPLYDDDGNLRAAPKYKFISEETWNAVTAGTVQTADANGDGTPDPWTFVEEKAAFEALTAGDAPDRLLGIAQAYQTFQEYRVAADWSKPAYTTPFNTNVPDLKTISLAALNVLDNDKDGFFLMIEAGATDWAGHFCQAGRLIEEMDDFYKAVAAVCQWIETHGGWDDTLLIVTGDHETGYLTGAEGVNCPPVNNGKGNMPTMYFYLSPVYKTIAWHTNQLVPFFAKGAGALTFYSYADQLDPVRGAYLDNTEISLGIRTLLGTAPSPWAAKEVYQAIDKSLVPMGLQRSYQAAITREQFCELAYQALSRAAGMPLMTPTDDKPMPFTDTASDIVYTLNLFGIASGVSPDKFDPSSPITREQAAVMLSKMLSYLGVALPQGKFFYKDHSSISSAAQKAASDLYLLGIMKGLDSSKFAPKSTLTVEQSIVSMLRLYNVKAPA